MCETKGELIDQCNNLLCLVVLRGEAQRERERDRERERERVEKEG